MAREIYDNELKRIEKISGYNKTRAYSMLDDMATAYISNKEYGHLDKSLIVTRTARKNLKAQGFSKAEIDDFLLQKSYLSKTTMRKICNDSIYNDDMSIKPIVENIPALYKEKQATDLLIDTLKSKPDLLKALKKGISQQALNKHYNIVNATALKDFYRKHKDIID